MRYLTEDYLAMINVDRVDFARRVGCEIEVLFESRATIKMVVRSEEDAKDVMKEIAKERKY